jgi:predicted nuclease of restriction endonuclease-like (RecB) superfamily
MFKFSPKFQKMRKKGQGLVRKAYRAVKKLSEVLLFKDPYNFEFLSLGKSAQERDLEKALIERIRDFLLELAFSIQTLRERIV